MFRTYLHWWFPLVSELLDFPCRSRIRWANVSVFVLDRRSPQVRDLSIQFDRRDALRWPNWPISPATTLFSFEPHTLFRFGRSTIECEPLSIDSHWKSLAPMPNLDDRSKIVSNRIDCVWSVRINRPVCSAVNANWWRIVRNRALWNVQCTHRGVLDFSYGHKSAPTFENRDIFRRVWLPAHTDRLRLKTIGNGGNEFFFFSWIIRGELVTRQNNSLTKIENQFTALRFVLLQ